LFIVITCCEQAIAADHTIAGAAKTPSPTLVEVLEVYRFSVAAAIDSAGNLSKTAAGSSEKK
jgi:hypothetical protein